MFISAKMKVQRTLRTWSIHWGGLTSRLPVEFIPQMTDCFGSRQREVTHVQTQLKLKKKHRDRSLDIPATLDCVREDITNIENDFRV
jgi:hypothetical protein